MSKLPTLQELLEAGVHFGHQVRRGNPRMRRFIYGARDGVHIIDLTESEKGLKEAVEFLTKTAAENKTILFVGTKKQAKEIVEEWAKKLNLPYLTERWIGGFLTNFEEIFKNIKKLKELKEQKEKGELTKYTKKEQLLLDRKMFKFERDLGGALDLEKLPDAIFVVDAVKDEVAVKEAHRIGIKVVAIADSNSDPTLMDYPIPGNDDAIKSIRIIMDTVGEAIAEGQKQAGADAKKVEAKKVKDDAKAVKDLEKKELEEKEAAKLAEEVAVAEEVVEKKEVAESERKI